ncbi:YdcH family protein [Pseudomonas sp. 5P_3.1_Bac2]|uniref:YdcH family protein n=1 Tax=Pseudomonas sp. 5P_3.1_Bac2 TaxID=2971617 RepID=UPI0021C70213|nr:YdcH family protein [Pseudomonas sp. 5P_3.1_Bac2]MCU1718201.1 YdcH family protein [Pseudomonas sp. 5P_3.1_Bac2]
MYVEHHPLSKDFPELRDELRNLRASDAHFARLAEHYEHLDKRICAVEADLELLSDEQLSSLKQERVALKDELLRMLKRAAGQCCGCGKGCKDKGAAA